MKNGQQRYEKRRTAQNFSGLFLPPPAECPPAKIVSSGNAKPRRKKTNGWRKRPACV